MPPDHSLTCCYSPPAAVHSPRSRESPRHSAGSLAASHLLRYCPDSKIAAAAVTIVSPIAPAITIQARRISGNARHCMRTMIAYSSSPRSAANLVIENLLTPPTNILIPPPTTKFHEVRGVSAAARCKTWGDLHDQHRVAVAVEAILFADRFLIRPLDEFAAGEAWQPAPSSVVRGKWKFVRRASIA